MSDLTVELRLEGALPPLRASTAFALVPSAAPSLADQQPPDRMTETFRICANLGRARTNVTHRLAGARPAAAGDNRVVCSRQVWMMTRINLISSPCPRHSGFWSRSTLAALELRNHPDNLNFPSLPRRIFIIATLGYRIVL
jgi:hypothetical protein